MEKLEADRDPADLSRDLSYFMGIVCLSVHVEMPNV